MTDVAYDLVIIGGGLAGLLAAARAEELGAHVALVDESVSSSPGGLGGFAPFSGAKFSFFPAGTGLSPLVGGDDALCDLYRRLLYVLARSGVDVFDVPEAVIRGEECPAGPALSLREYYSIVLEPRHVQTLIDHLVALPARADVRHARATALEIADGGFGVRLANGDRLRAPSVIFAAGRLGAHLLLEAGVPESCGKGLDAGVRLEFDGAGPVAGLRAHGPDAKFLADGVRTFCLNSPGRIYHYPGLGYSLPGGIVGNGDTSASNVAVLCRLPDRAAALVRFARTCADPQRPSPPMAFVAEGGLPAWSDGAREILGANVTDRIDEFLDKLQAARLLDLGSRYRVHYPLFDWHWPVFSKPGTLETSVHGLFAAGDASGHARGLLQAAAMGWIAAEEALGR